MKHVGSIGRVSQRSDAGVALIAALSFLVLFAMLGTAYVVYMTGEFDRTRYEVKTLHARTLASAGINAAVGELQRAVGAGEPPSESYTFSLPVYGASREADYHDVTVEVSDEAARINLNVAPREVLEAIGFTRANVRELKRSLPRDGAYPDGERRWLLSVDEVRRRGFVDAATYASWGPGLVTVFSANPSEPDAYINLNSASPRVLAAVLNTTEEEARAMAEKRPFTSWADVLNKTGGDPARFNVRPAPGDVGGMPSAFALNSRCYRLVSEVALPVSRGGARRIRHRVEAVVYLDADGGYEARYWSESTGLGEVAAEDVEAPTEAPAETVEEDDMGEDVSEDVGEAS